MIYDCFMFYNELDLLEIRLNELNDVVDYFVLVEGERTHQNKSKNMLFEKNIDRYKTFLSKIIHVVVPAEKYKNNDSMYNDRMQRNHICLGLQSAHDDDNVIISDLDEIPKAEAVLEGIKNYKEPVTFDQLYHYYYLNTQMIVNGNPYNTGSVLLKKSKFINNTEFVRNKLNHVFPSIKNGGWHFSFLGNADIIFNKIQNYAHSEFNDIPKSKIEERFNFLEDPFGRPGHIFKKMDDLSYLPDYVKNNLTKFNNYIKK